MGEEKETDQPSAVGWLEGIEKRVGSWGKKKKKEAHPAKWMSLKVEIQSVENVKRCCRGNAFMEKFSNRGGFYPFDR